MKILLCSVDGLGEAAIERSLKRLGYSVALYDRKCDNFDTDKKYLEELVACINKEQPDIIFSIDYIPLISKACQVLRKAYVSWVYDCPEIRLYSSSISNPVNRIFLFDKVMYERFHRRSPNTVFYLPLATDPVKDFTGWVSDDEKRKYTHDVTFIGSMYNEKKRQFHQIDGLSEHLRGFVEGLAQAQLRVYGYNFIADSLSDDMVSAIKKELDYAAIDDYNVDDREIVADQYIGAYCSCLDRRRTLQAAAYVHKLSIYTDSDISELKNVENFGVSDSNTMTPKIFHCSKINLNITSKTIQTGIPLRIFDILGVGGFVLSNYQAEMEELFTIGKDLAVYEDTKDLQEKIIYYLKHEDERREIADNGYKTVCENYSYDNMLSLMLEIAGV